MINLKLQNYSERFVMHDTDENIAKVENLARKESCTKSWIYRAALEALIKKFPCELPDKYTIKRPKKFAKKFRQTTVYFYQDRQKWFSLCRIWKVELGPLIRFALQLYEQGELELDLESEKTVKTNKQISIGCKKRKKLRRNRNIYLFQNKSLQYLKNEFWIKNPQGNLFLMEWGLLNRKYALELPKDFKIPICFGG